MADKNYQLEFTMSDGSKKTLSFTAPQGPQGLAGERGLAMCYLNEGVVSSRELFPFSSFIIPTGYALKIGDLVLHKTGQLAYISNISEGTQQAEVTLIMGASLIGPAGDPGTAGKNGSDGVGIKSINQTTTSTADDGNNIFTVTLTNGTTATFTVQNGSKGSKGETGATGPTGPQGPTGPKGDPFSISKIYSSVAAMNAGYSSDGVGIGQFVLIDTGNVNNADNSKLYYKGASAYVFLTDLSGAQGIQGPQGPQGIQGPAGNPGATGEQGVGITSIDIVEL